MTPFDLPGDRSGPGPFSVALIAFFTLVDLFAAQAILPILAERYQVGPAAVGVAVNASTAGMAIGALLTAVLGARIDRRRGVVASLVLLALPSALLAWAPGLGLFAALRVAQGMCMACAFTLTLAYLGEALAQRRQATAFAAYVTGNVGSNLVGRMISSLTAGMFGAPTAFITFAVLNLAGAAFAYRVLRGGARRDVARPMLAATLAQAFSPALIASYLLGFCILFAFIGVFSYVNFVLMRAPLSLGMMSIGPVYLVFAPAIIATPLAGAVALRIGPRAALLTGLAVALIGLWLLAGASLSAVICGMVLVGLGTFFAQATATGQISRIAGPARSAANGLYLTAYFTGGLVGAAVLGSAFETLGWIGCLQIIGLSLAVGGLLGLSFAGRLENV